jgi:hypothetical protein
MQSGRVAYCINLLHVVPFGQNEFELSGNEEKHPLMTSTPWAKSTNRNRRNAHSPSNSVSSRLSPSVFSRKRSSVAFTAIIVIYNVYRKRRPMPVFMLPSDKTYAERCANSSKGSGAAIFLVVIYILFSL